MRGKAVSRRRVKPAAIALPASRTSAWFSGVAEIPAAGFEMHEIAATRMPWACAAMASRTVLIPTA